MKLDFVKLSPTQNMTIIVKTPVTRADHSRVAALLMDYAGVFAEQVGFIEPPTLPGAHMRLQMMGGEFCGNAAMCLAAIDARNCGIPRGETRAVPVEISGAEGMLTAEVTRREDAYACRVAMPLPMSIAEKDAYSIVRLPGIAHAVIKCDDPEARRPYAESALRAIAADIDEEAVGLMLYSPVQNRMLPLVYVKNTDSMVWERGCGSGSAAVGALMCHESKMDVAVPLEQPGGMITARARWNGSVAELSIEGTVKIVCEGTAYV